MIAINTYMGSFTQTESAILGPVDNWGNIKIPRIDAFKENSIEPDNGWYDAEKLPKGLEIWSGLFGLPVLGLSQFTNQKVEFTTKSVYRRELEDFPSYPAQIVAVNTRDYNGIHTFQCKLEQRVVEAQIRFKVRHFEDKPFGGVNFTQIYYRGEPYLGFFYQTCHSEVEDGTPVPLICPAQVILNGTTKFSFHRMGDDYTTYSQNVSTIPTSKLSARFGMLLNTIVASAKTGFALFGGLPYSNLTFYGSSRPPESWEYGVDYVPHFDAPFTGAAANATVVTDHEVFNPTYAWCILSIVSSCVLITLGVGNALCNFRTLTPNMFDPVMGWTYMNPYMPLPPSSPDESEYPLAVEARLGALGKMTVRLGRPYDQTWATAQEKDGRFEALREVVPFDHNDPDQTDVEVEEPHHRESIYAPIVLGFKDKFSVDIDLRIYVHNQSSVDFVRLVSQPYHPEQILLLG
ncbi:hypothetical protein AAP_06257 [Ascosphaera apis ARSEF 7405]|uniref:Uncharacterized protein n=1 Tax=Ascosphaera apis ARSEF 7405 TaxID=392613 RepID=A0A167UX65_9EURO|nr:hypothetical protein AAP_06257 [Ascosphaera apis ARSEF 7405]